MRVLTTQEAAEADRLLEQYASNAGHRAFLHRKYLLAVEAAARKQPNPCEALARALRSRGK